MPITEHLDRSLVLYWLSYGNQIFMGDFNIGPENTYIKSFCDNFDLTNSSKNLDVLKTQKIHH